ncbi:sensor domain-containing diguanylate cyclase [Maridesulfovibrio hydrothermalis]|uniref:diguanylate cyclase n=1 Tax=Maridesulfovibrio hydrothermalis AM13 = DSM 14728 TaxID=1121451 RepID=L0R9M4_9BACT|nr:sensor domain-containing diguanylate cyclase [Maridesulfovibrio hydrothermalis]CCO23439.1 Diguanylate cyclase with PAS/PAC and GAF sensors [Maridesulfovibrio hydrothermalis AM13 = DSM 14728]
MGINTGTYHNIGNSYEKGSNAALLSAIARSAEELTSGKGWPDGVHDLLETLGRTTGVSRVWIFQTIKITETHITQNYTFEWAAAPKHKQLGMPMFSMFTNAIDRPGYRDLIQSRMRGEWQKVVTDQLEQDWLRDNLEAQKIKSMLTIPIIVEDEWWGTLGFDDCDRAYDWSDVEIALLKTAGDLISNAVLRDRLSAKRKQFAILKQLTASSVWEFDFNTGQIWCSPEVLHSVPVPTDNIRFSLHNALRLIHQGDRRKLITAAKIYMKGSLERVFRFDMRLFTDCGDLRWVELIGNIRKNKNGRPTQLAGILIDISQRKREEDRLREEAVTDPLTGVTNRRMFEHKLQEHIDYSVNEGRIFSLLFFDIDRFKQLNDTYGHQVGDKGLCHVTKVCEKILRPNDTLARLGGDEFALILPETDENTVRKIGERIRRKIEATRFKTKGKEYSLTVSVGLATSEGQLTTPARIIETADVALYQAKQTGRNKVVSLTECCSKG